MAWNFEEHRAVPYLIALIFLLPAVQCTFGTEQTCNSLLTPGVTIPAGDIIIRHGDPLDIYCKLHDEFLHNNPNTSSKDIIYIVNNTSVPSEWLKIVNYSTVLLHIDNPPPSSNLYTCQLKDNKRGICINSVAVGEPPAKVTNFSCIGYNYENLTCKWIAPHNYVDTSYRLMYHFQGRNSRASYDCPEIKSQKNQLEMSCFWSDQTRPQYRQVQPFYYFYLSMSNVFGNYTMDKVTFDHFANVLPEPPENLTVRNRTSNSITLSWKIGSSMFHFPPGVNYRVAYQSTYDNKDTWHVVNTTSINKLKEPVFELTNLKYAHSYYDIRVSMRSNRSTDENMWSRNVSVAVQTLSSIPGAAPKSCSGSFEINNSIGFYREIYIYWQEISEQMKNGENFSYKVISVEEGSVEKTIEPVEITYTYAKFTNLLSYNYTFRVVSTNEVGNSVENTTIYVPSMSELVPKPQLFTKISFGNQVYELSWIKPQGNVPIRNYTIFYCRYDYDRPFPCKGYLEWITVPGNVTLKNITVPKDKIYQFAISANSDHTSSGMVWASCTVLHGKGFTTLKSLWVENIGSDFIEIGWKLDCSDRIGSIEGYIIFYCPIVSPVDLTCKGEELNTTIKGEPKKNLVRVTNLRPYTTYMLAVSVKSKNSLGPQSDPLYNTTLEAAPGPPENVTVINITSTSIAIQWLPPKAMNGVLRYYEVHVRSQNMLSPLKLRPEVEKSRALELRNLTSFTKYDITVYAWTQHCSRPSTTLTTRTAISVPGVMNSPNIKFRNESIILVNWDPPMKAGGHLDFYELRVKEKTNSENHTKTFNTTELFWEVPNCGHEKSNKVIYFSVRAINIDHDKRYPGPWSPEIQNSCSASSRFIYYAVTFAGMFVLLILVFVLKKLWHRCKIMRDVEVKLPPGLTPTISNDLGLTHWPVPLQKSPNDDPMLHMRTDSSADEEHLLAKKAEFGESVTNGDSSGCSSGHESVTSSLASGTNLSSTSDSGTEQPRTPSTDSISRENSLRQRRTGSESLGWDSEIAWPNPKGYVLTMPMLINDKLTSASARCPGIGTTLTAAKPIDSSNYCVLGVDNTIIPSSDHAYVPVSIPPAQNDKTSPYITCDSIYNVKQQQQPLNLVTSAKKSDDLDSKSPPTYMMAAPLSADKGRQSYVKLLGTDILPTGKLIQIEPVDRLDLDVYQVQQPQSKDNLGPAYVKTGDLQTAVVKPIQESTYVKTDDILGFNSKDLTSATSLHDPCSEAPDSSLNSYCRLGWDIENTQSGVASTKKPVIDSPPVLTKGYVSHRHFENKSLKED